MTLSKAGSWIAAGIVGLSLIGTAAYVVFGTNYATKHLGGDYTIDLPKGEKLEPYTVQWQPNDSNIWYLTSPMEEGDTPRTYKFHESSNFGVSSGYEEEGRDDGNLLAVEELPVAETAEEAEKFSLRMRRK